jgi:uncharacterized membrane protein YedE/YeeE
MTIDWTHFTPWASLAGGVLLGIAAALFILVNGRILGISGIVGGLLAPKRGDAGWRIAFLLGMLAAPATLLLLAPAGFISPPRIDAGYAAIVIAGLLVGYGTRLGSGCTSGHGVCGLSRLSPRSLVATGAFMAAGFAIVFVIRHLL